MKATLSPRSTAFGAFEWATSTVNFMTGCRHGCKYCYARAMAARFGRTDRLGWNVEVIRDRAITKGYGERAGTVMFPSSHDLQADHIDHIKTILSKLLVAGNRVLIVTKPHIEVVRKICSSFSDHKKMILFRFSIGSVSTRLLRFWEPHAPTFAERMASLRYAFRHGFETSVSCEPMLDTSTEALVTKTLPFVTDAIWIGKPNLLLRRLRANGEDNEVTLRAARALIDSLSDDYVRGLHDRYQSDNRIKWKDSIKKIVGIPLSTTRGNDA